MNLNEFRSGAKEVLTKMEKERAEQSAKLEKLRTDSGRLNAQEWQKNNSAIIECQNERNRIVERARDSIRALVAEYCKSNYPEEHLDASLLNKDYVTMLNSGIVLTSSELGELHDAIVKGYKADDVPSWKMDDWRATNMRLINDYAKKNGVVATGAEDYKTNTQKASEFRAGVETVLKTGAMQDGNAEQVNAFFGDILGD